MRRFIQVAPFLALVGLISMALVCGSRAQNPPAVAPRASAGIIPPEALGAQSPNAASPMLSFSGTVALTPSPQPLSAQTVAQPAAPQPFVRILTEKMAMSPEPQSFVDASGSDESPAVAKINAALASITEIHCDNTKFSEVIETLKKRHKIEIQLDAAALKDGGFDENTPITKHNSGLTLRSALRLILNELRLKFVIQNEVLLITTPEKAESEEYMTTRIYFVKDLILVRNESGEIETDFQHLIDLIQESIETKTWADNGGTGTITPYQFRDHCLLAISQTQEVHEEIVALLAALRRSAASGPKDANELLLPKRPKAAASLPTTRRASSIGNRMGGIF
jgi:hypothetical protein